MAQKNHEVLFHEVIKAQDQWLQLAQQCGPDRHSRYSTKQLEYNLHSKQYRVSFNSAKDTETTNIHAAIAAYNELILAVR